MLKRRVALISTAVAAVVVALIVLFVTADAESDPLALDTNQLEGKAAPAIETTDSEGRPFSLDDYRGRWVLLNFFATWCTPCITEHPELVAFSEAHQERGDAAVVSVAFNDTPQAVSDFFDTNGGEWAILSDDGNISLDFAVVGLPESYLVDPDGVVVQKFMGGITRAEVEDEMRKR